MPEQNQEPLTVSTSTTGTHATGNFLNEAAEQEKLAMDVDTEGLVWIEREDLAKQGMARKGDMKNAQAAPDHPHLAKRSRSGGRQ